MSKKIPFNKRLVLFLVAGIVMMIGSAGIIAKEESRIGSPSATAAQANPACSTVTDAEIEKAVREKIGADPRFNIACKHNNPGLAKPTWEKDSDHIVVRVKDKKLFLHGFVISPNGKTSASRALIRAVEKLARSASNCITGVGNNLRTIKGGGCNSRTQVLCNGICLPAGSC